MNYPLPSLLLFCCFYFVGQTQSALGQFFYLPPVSNGQIVRYATTPSVIREGSTQPILLEVTTEGKPTAVRLSIGGLPETVQELNDQGVDGDKRAGDGVFTTFASRLGYIRAYSGEVKVGEVYGFAIVSQPDVPTVVPRKIDNTTQYSDYIFNVVVPSTATPLTEADRLRINQLFYKYHADEFDFINYVLTPGFIGPVSHSLVANNVMGIGLTQVDNSAKFGSKGRLKGLIHFPEPNVFDGVGRPFLQAIGRQWISPSNPLLKVGVPNWPLSNLASGVMGLGAEGKDFPFEFYDLGTGYTLNSVFFEHWYSPLLMVSPPPRISRTIYNDWELYLMGLVPPSEVKTGAIVFKNQSMPAQPYFVGIYPKTAFDTYTAQSRIADAGVRLPTAAQSQKRFSVATIVLSEQLLSAVELSHFDYMAKRAEGRQLVMTRDLFPNLVGRPFNVATGGRATMRTLLNTNADCATVPAQPTITTSLGASLCQGQLTVLTASSLGQNTPIWYHNGSPLPERASSITATQAGDYTLSVRDDRGCSSAISEVLSLSSIVVPFRPSIVAIGNDVISETRCFPGVLITNQRVGPYQWFLDGQLIEGETKSQLSPRETGAYTVGVKYPNGCTDLLSTPQSISVGSAAKKPGLVADNTTFVCGGEPIVLRAITDSKVAHKWYWFRNGDYIAQTASPTYTATTTGEYAVQLIEETSCPSWLSKSISLTANATQTKPTITTTVNGLQSSSPANNQWFSGSSPLGNGNGQVFSSPYTGVVYTVRVNNGGCLIDSDPFLYVGPTLTMGTVTTPSPITVTSPSPITATTPAPVTVVSPQIITANEPALPGSVTLRHAPNPVGQLAQITFELPKATPLTLRLMNASGSFLRTLAEGHYAAGSHIITLDTGNLPPGLYLYRLEADGMTQTNKLMVVK